MSITFSLILRKMSKLFVTEEILHDFKKHFKKGLIYKSFFENISNISYKYNIIIITIFIRDHATFLERVI